jgi:hypothetical protein
VSGEQDTRLCPDECDHLHLPPDPGGTVTVKLTAAEYREALALVLTELEDMGPPPMPPEARYAYAERRGRLLGHLRTIVGDSPHGTPPTYGLRALRREREEVTPAEERWRADRVEDERAAEAERW